MHSPVNDKFFYRIILLKHFFFDIMIMYCFLLTVTVEQSAYSGTYLTQLRSGLVPQSVCLHNLDWGLHHQHISRPSSLSSWTTQCHIQSREAKLSNSKFHCSTSCHSISQYVYGCSIQIMIQIIQPIRCNSFTSLLLDVYVWLNMFRASPRPSPGAHNCTRSLWFYRWREAAGARPRPTMLQPLL